MARHFLPDTRYTLTQGAGGVTVSGASREWVTWQELGAGFALESPCPDDLHLKIAPLVTEAELDVPEHRGAEDLATHQLAGSQACGSNHSKCYN